jgi:16S rRNA (cytosine1402-N4)-methyltransferase
MHEPVMSDEVMEYLAVHPGGVYCDATLGAGGHALRILEMSAPDGRLLGIDRDAESLAKARLRLQELGSRAVLMHGNFADAPALLTEAGFPACDGVLLDLGISSDQLEDSERGFSFANPGPLDMRMDRDEGETVHALIERLPADQLGQLIGELGEQPGAHRVARAIKQAVARDEIRTTNDLAAVVAEAAPRRGRIHPATRVFMALRIAVNDELAALQRFLSTFAGMLRIGGRVVIIAFHSLEDRLVKHRFRELAHADQASPRLALLTRKPIRPSDDEVSRNPRARSARLRAAERIA